MERRRFGFANLNRGQKRVCETEIRIWLFSRFGLSIDAMMRKKSIVIPALKRWGYQNPRLTRRRC
jgi:hypothetical protein